MPSWGERGAMSDKSDYLQGFSLYKRQQGRCAQRGARIHRRNGGHG